MCDGPGIGGHEFGNGVSFDGGIVGALIWRDAGHAGVLDAHDFLFAQAIGYSLVAFGCKSNTLERAVGSTSTRVNKRPMGERDDV